MICHCCASETFDYSGGFGNSRRGEVSLTGIVCTIGPSTQSVDRLGELVEAGMRVVRLNFSHGDGEFHLATIRNLRQYLSSIENTKSIAVLLDTKGPEVRIGLFRDGNAELHKGDLFRFVVGEDSFIGDSHSVHISHSHITDIVKPGDILLVDDGLISFRVSSVCSEYIECVVQNDGILFGRKGVNIPDVSLLLPSLTEKDRTDIAFAIEHKVDFIAASFVRSASDVMEIRKLLGKSKIQIISKIENKEGLSNFDEILKVSDGIMVARGDLGVEIPIENVFREQKMIIRKCNLAGKPCITATQMLESMIEHPRPTRAEVTDIANAVIDGSDCVMLSGETAKGSYPLEAVKIMARICLHAEANINYLHVNKILAGCSRTPIESIALCATNMCLDASASLIVVVSESGKMARALSMCRPCSPIIAITPSGRVSRQLLVCRGIIPYLCDDLFDVSLLKAILFGTRKNLARIGDMVVVVSGDQEEATVSLRKIKESCLL